MIQNQNQPKILSQNPNPNRKNPGFQPVGSLFAQYQPAEDKGYITQEFQDYGYRLALELDDLSHKSLYIRLAKTNSRARLEQARAFVSDAKALSKPKLFMWKLKQLRLAGQAALTGQIPSEKPKLK